DSSSISLSFSFPSYLTTHTYTLSLHDALPISARYKPGCECRLSLESQFCAGGRLHRFRQVRLQRSRERSERRYNPRRLQGARLRSEEHTSELQSRFDLVCRLLLEKKN